MRIDNGLPSFYAQPQIPAERYSAAASPAISNASGTGFTSPGLINPNARPEVSYPGVIVDISPEARAVYERNQAADKINGIQVNSAEKTPLARTGECETCKNRKYQDQSDDSGVSFQSPTHLSPAQAPSAVLSHEYEHVTNEQAKADKEGRRVISQTVSLQTSFCPECGRMYVSGGTTRTITVKDNTSNAPGPADHGSAEGLDITA